MATKEALKIHQIVKYPDPVLAKHVRAGDGVRREAEDAGGGDVREHVCGTGDWSGGAADCDIEAAYGDRRQLQEESRRTSSC